MPFFRKKKGKNRGEIKVLTAQEAQKLTDRHFRTVAGWLCQPRGENMQKGMGGIGHFSG